MHARNKLLFIHDHTTAGIVNHYRKCVFKVLIATYSVISYLLERTLSSVLSNQGMHYVTLNLVSRGLEIFPGEHTGFSLRC